MPTYDYECDACGHRFEEFQTISADPLTKCPQCKKKKLRRLFGTGAALMFKGSGFYQTDYRSEGYRKAAAADGGSKGDSGSSGSSSGSDGAKSSSSETKSSSESKSSKSSKKAKE